jgi:cell division protease FtsH
MVAGWGMAERIGPVDLRHAEDHPFLGQTIAQPRDFADATAARVDAVVIDLLTEAEARATEILTAERAGLDALVSRLETEETLDFGEIRACLAPGAAEDPAERPSRDLGRLARPPRIREEQD